MNLILSMISRLSSGDIYLSLDIFLGVSLSFLFVTVSELICRDFFGTFVILSAILLPIKLPVASALFYTSVADCLA